MITFIGLKERVSDTLQMIAIVPTTNKVTTINMIIENVILLMLSTGGPTTPFQLPFLLVTISKKKFKTPSYRNIITIFFRFYRFFCYIFFKNVRRLNITIM